MIRFPSLPACAVLTAGLLLAACAPAPIYHPGPHAIEASPSTVAQTPERFDHGPVVWGGRVIKVTNRAHDTAIELLAYPLDKSQRPLRKKPAIGRFIAIVPGYLEPLDYPAGRLMTISGHLQGTRAGKVGGAEYVFPRVATDDYHLWTSEELRSPWSNVHVGLGVGVGVH